VTPEEAWRAKSNDVLVAASRRLSDYTDVGQRVIAAELERRREAGLISDADFPGTHQEVPRSSGETELVPSGYLLRLWQGHIPLATTFWVWGLLGLLVWRIVIGAANAADQPALVLTVALASIAYAVFALISIWRSAGRYRGRRIWAELARIFVAANVAGLLVGLIFK
jgi:hypothetical protein